MSELNLAELIRTALKAIGVDSTGPQVKTWLQNNKSVPASALSSSTFASTLSNQKKKMREELAGEAGAEAATAVVQLDRDGALFPPDHNTDGTPKNRLPAEAVPVVFNDANHTVAAPAVATGQGTNAPARMLPITSGPTLQAHPAPKPLNMDAIIKGVKVLRALAEEVGGKENVRKLLELL